MKTCTTPSWVTRTVASPPGTAFQDIPDDWVCPVCGARKKEFRKLRPGEEYQDVSEDLVTGEQG